jgi:hypothetical protein
MCVENGHIRDSVRGARGISDSRSAVISNGRCQTPRSNITVTAATIRACRPGTAVAHCPDHRTPYRRYLPVATRTATAGTEDLRVATQSTPVVRFNLSDTTQTVVSCCASRGFSFLQDCTEYSHKNIFCSHINIRGGA